MKIYDCFMFFDEEMLLDLRLNIMDKYVDKFVITESTYMHNGKSKKLLFDINKFSKFKDKIIYLPIYEPPPNIVTISKNDDLNKQQSIMIDNAKKRELYQINKTNDVIKKADPDDIIIVSDLDEIPNLENVNFEKNKKIFFQQLFFYYKLNLFLPLSTWCGSRACTKKNLISPQWLRNIKDRNYPFWRIDTLASKQKYTNIHFIDDGGWHFSYLKTPQDIEKKLKSYLHHREYDINPLGIDKIEQMIKDKKTIYDLKVDMRIPKFKGSHILKTADIKLLPSYLQDNIDKYKEWMD